MWKPTYCSLWPLAGRQEHNQNFIFNILKVWKAYMKIHFSQTAHDMLWLRKQSKTKWKITAQYAHWPVGQEHSVQKLQITAVWSAVLAHWAVNVILEHGGLSVYHTLQYCLFPISVRVTSCFILFCIYLCGTTLFAVCLPANLADQGIRLCQVSVLWLWVAVTGPQVFFSVELSILVVRDAVNPPKQDGDPWGFS